MSIATSPKAQERQKQREKAKARQQANDLRTVMSTPEGRRVLRWIIYDVCDLEGVVVTNEDRRDAVHGGQRWVGKHVRDKLAEHCPLERSKMNREAEDTEAEDAVHLKDAEQTARQDDEA